MAIVNRISVGETDVIVVDADPNGVITAPTGSVALLNTGTGTAYVNTDGSTSWTDMSGGGVESYEISLPIAGTLSVGDDQTPVPKEVGADCTINKVRITSRTGPVGADATFEVEYSNTADPPASWATLVGPTNLKIVDGNRKNSYTLPSGVDLDEGEELKLNCDQIGLGTAGADVMVTLIGVKR